MNTHTTSDHYAVLGNPVAHSRSPFIHAQFAQQCQQNLVYNRLLCPLDGFEAAVRNFANTGGRGCNVTVPFKFAALKLAHQPTARAALAGAANTLRFDGDIWAADNTDGVGLVRDIETGAGVALNGLHVLLIGAGGAAAGVLGPLLERRPAAVVVCNRSEDKAQALLHSHQAFAASHGVVLQACGLRAASQAAQANPQSGFDVVINASASSLHGAASPVQADVLRAGSLAVDLMYGAPAKAWLSWAGAHGAQTRDGLGMLVEQAAEAFYFWRGLRPSTAPVLKALRAGLEQGD